MSFADIAREYLKSVPQWLLVIAVAFAVMLFMFQILWRGAPLMCGNGEIFPATDCKDSTPPSTATTLLQNAIVVFDREEGCPPGWQEYDAVAGRFIVGVGRHTEHDEYGNEVTNFKFGDTGGGRTHKLLKSEMPSHEHTYTFSSGRISPGHPDHSPNEFGAKDIPDKPTGTTGGNEPHNNMPPFIALHYCKIG